VLIPYVGQARKGLIRIMAETLWMETNGLGVPLITKVQRHLEPMIGGTNPHHPVIIDDVHLVEIDFLCDLCFSKTLDKLWPLP